MRREPKTDSREHPHERDKGESKKEIKEGEVRAVGGNVGEIVFMGSKGSKSLKKIFFKKKISKFNESSFSRVLYLETTFLLGLWCGRE